eukprot:6212421-Pleurochrysis_carterae.AAC.2
MLLDERWERCNRVGCSTNVARRCAEVPSESKCALHCRRLCIPSSFARYHEIQIGFVDRSDRHRRWTLRFLVGVMSIFLANQVANDQYSFGYHRAEVWPLLSLRKKLFAESALCLRLLNRASRCLVHSAHLHLSHKVCLLSSISALSILPSQIQRIKRASFSRIIFASLDLAVALSHPRAGECAHGCTQRLSPALSQSLRPRARLSLDRAGAWRAREHHDRVAHDRHPGVRGGLEAHRAGGRPHLASTLSFLALAPSSPVCARPVLP